ncbi:TIGR01440 family protein [Clostridiaceae bacterium OttesenSCG-928-D20]|nr:TIGR01440 family protein [Clostridiaceae bacterium OttesenSCG-928-D20]
MTNEITMQADCAMRELLAIIKPRANDIIVVGCSSSEAAGSNIGKNSSPETALAILDGIYPHFENADFYLAVQCCEHLNRSLIIEREIAERLGLEMVNVRPVPKAGGAFATAAFEQMKSPVAVEKIRAVGGLDIGATLIGMHLKEVAVPLRLSVKKIGEASLNAAKTRLKLVGGTRAQYIED